MFLTRLKLAQGDVTGAADILAKADQSVRQHNFVFRMPEVAAVQVLTLLHQGNLAAAADLAEKHGLPISLARVHLVQGDPSAALAVLGPLRQQVEAKGLEDERLKVMVLNRFQAFPLAEHGQGPRPQHLRQARCPQPDAGGCQGKSFGGLALHLIARHTKTAKPGGPADSGPLFCYPLVHPIILQAYN